MKRFHTQARSRARSGQTLVEYSLVLALISVVAIAVLAAMGVSVKGIFTTVSNQMALANNGGSGAGSGDGSGSGTDGSGTGSGSSGGGTSTPPSTRPGH